MGRINQNCPNPVAKSGGIVSDITLTRQPENIAGLEVGVAQTLVCVACIGGDHGLKFGPLIMAAARQSRLRHRATIRADRLRRLSSKAGRPGRHASRENRSALACSLSVAHPGSPIVRRRMTVQATGARIVAPESCRRHRFRRLLRLASPRLETRSVGDETAEST